MDARGRGVRTGPDFLVIGAAKSGTTALDEFLRGHPALRMPRTREPNYFAFADAPPTYRDHRGRPAAMVHTTVTDRRTYLASFPPGGIGTLTGETSPAYLYVPGTAERIAEMRPDARLIVVLRDPAARAFSAYQHLKREGREPLTFAEAVAAEPQRISDGWGLLWRYVDTGRYAEQLLRYFEVFPRHQVLVLRHDRMSRDPQGTCRDVFSFLGVDPDVPVDVSGRFNVSGVPRNRLVHRITNPPASLRRAVTRMAPTALVDRLRRTQASALSRNLERAEPDPTGMELVRDELRGDMRCLADLTGWDLTGWMSTPDHEP